MRSRTVREGSVGLLILLGLALLGGLILWIRGFAPGRRSYIITVGFPTVSGIQEGAQVQYRGVQVGQTKTIRASANLVELDLEISPTTVVIPRNSLVAVYQTSFTGESVVEITPQQDIPAAFANADPLGADCNSQVIVCNGDKLQGQGGVTFNQLLDATTRFANTFSDPRFFNELRQLTRNSAGAATGVATLTREVAILSRSLQQEVGSVTREAALSARSIGRAADQTALTAAQVSDLLNTNRVTIVSTLNSISTTSTQIQSVLGQLSPALGGSDNNLVQNLQTLSANAAQASATLRNLTDAVGTADNILLLQQTLDSARATFQNAQKITADLDELTGDPRFRDNVRSLVNGLSGLVSSTRQLEQDAAIAQTLTPIASRFPEGMVSTERNAEGSAAQVEQKPEAGQSTSIRSSQEEIAPAPTASDDSDSDLSAPLNQPPARSNPLDQ
ncbi:MCE family protein [Cyanobacteria bacterium FACHB-502]|nr:MCE family protein [Cyanobacteria bacterium FACHB-502]MBD2027993.1 MCE family protein [Leptolyngbya sp. FACHB-711]